MTDSPPRARKPLSAGSIPLVIATSFRSVDERSTSGVAGNGGSPDTAHANATVAVPSSPPSDPAPSSPSAPFAVGEFRKRGVCVRCEGPKPPGPGVMLCENCPVVPGKCHRCLRDKPPGKGRRLCDDCGRVDDTPLPCLSCGERERKARGSHYCDECAAIEADVARIRRAARVAMKRTPCLRCNRPKGPGHRALCDACRAKRDAPPMCKRCGRNPTRKQYAHYCELCFLETQRRGPKRKRREPSEAHKRREHARDRRPGDWEEPTPVRAIVAAPLVLAVDALPEEERLQMLEMVGLNVRSLFRYRSGEADKIQFAIADQIVTQGPWLWFDIWNARTVRVAAITARLYALRSRPRSREDSTRVMKWTRAATRRYGDLGPDTEALRIVGEAFTGDEGVVAA